MKTLYIECNMGAAGDMLMAALLELLDDKEKFIEDINCIGLADVSVSALPSVKCGVSGTNISVLIRGAEEESHDHDHHHENPHGGEHEHSDFHHIEHLISHLKVSDKVKKDASAIYNIIAEAESEVHGKPVSEVHFHEVGAMDAVADIVGVCMLIERLAPDEIIVSPIHVGSGNVRCSHGILPVPAPATALILRGIPVYGGTIKGELCTPTGAALLKYFADEFGAMPAFAYDKIGYGMGKKDFEAANCVRAYLGESKKKI